MPRRGLCRDCRGLSEGGVAGAGGRSGGRRGTERRAAGGTLIRAGRLRIRPHRPTRILWDGTPRRDRSSVPTGPAREGAATGGSDPGQAGCRRRRVPGREPRITRMSRLTSGGRFRRGRTWPLSHTRSPTATAHLARHGRDLLHPRPGRDRLLGRRRHVLRPGRQPRREAAGAGQRGAVHHPGQRERQRQSRSGHHGHGRPGQARRRHRDHGGRPGPRDAQRGRNRLAQHHGR